jgi:hypothetical protein
MTTKVDVGHISLGHPGPLHATVLPPGIPEIRRMAVQECVATYQILLTTQNPQIIFNNKKFGASVIGSSTDTHVLFITPAMQSDKYSFGEKPNQTQGGRV